MNRRRAPAQWEASPALPPVPQNGNLLVVQYSKRIVTEIDSKGRTVWQKSGLNGPLHAQRLPDGNTLIVHARGVSEYDPKGKEVWSKIGSNIRWVHRY